MIKIAILIGSPRKKGNTFLLANKLVEKLNKEKLSSEISFLYDFQIKPCIDCRACKKDDLECILDDDMNDLYSKMEDAEILIIGTPIYWFAPSAKTKLFIDRLRPYYANKKLSGKKAAILLPAGDGQSECDLTIDMFQRIFKALGITYLDAVTAKAYDVGEVHQDENAMLAVNNLAERINGLA